MPPDIDNHIMWKPRRATARRAAVIAITLMVAAWGGADTVDEPSPTPSTTPAVGLTAPPSTASQGGPAPELGGTKWNVTTYDQGTAFTNVWKTEITIAFAADGTFSGSGGCNTYQGTWETEGGYIEPADRGLDGNFGQVIKLGGLAWTEIGCEDEDIMVQEREFFDLLQRAGRWSIGEGNFTLRNSDSRLLFEAEPLS